MILIIDNYDSFTYNLVQYFGQTGCELKVLRNDALTVQDALAMDLDALVISPGPGTPDQAGISVNLIRESAGRLPVLGVCLGHQSIGSAFGAKIVRARQLMHGKTSMITHDSRGLLGGLPNPFQAIRYHSLAIDRETLPDCLEVTAESEDGEIMGIRHREFSVEGVQFHPESILTQHGMQIVNNFIQIAAQPHSISAGMGGLK